MESQQGGEIVQPPQEGQAAVGLIRRGPPNLGMEPSHIAPADRGEFAGSPLGQIEGNQAAVMTLTSRLFPGQIPLVIELQQMRQRGLVVTMATALGRILAVQNVGAQPDGLGASLLDGQDTVRPKRQSSDSSPHPFLQHEGFRLRRDAERKAGQRAIPDEDLALRGKGGGVDQTFGQFGHDDEVRVDAM